MRVSRHYSTVPTMKTRCAALWQAVRHRAAPLRRPPNAVIAVALLVLLGMFFSNTDWGGDPKTPRGDGRYRPVLARGDGHMMFLMTRSLVLDRDLVWDNDLARFGDPWRQKKTKTGRKNIPHPIGPPLVWSPVFATAHVTSKVANLFGADIPSHGYTMWHQRFVFLTSVLFAFGAALLGAVLARRYIGGAWAPSWATVAVLFGTSITYYATYMPSYAHAMDAMACAGFLAYWALTYGDMRLRRYVILGALLGLAALIRVQDLGMGIALAVEITIRGLQPPPEGEQRAKWMARLVLRGLVALGAALVAFTPQLLAWKVVYGEYLYAPAGNRYVRLDHPLILQTLFASKNGWFSTTPLAYAGTLGLLVVPRKARAIAAGLGAALLAQLYVNSSVMDWWGQASYGNRRMISVTIVLVFGLAALLRASGILLRRLPTRVVHGLGVSVLAWFVVGNMAWVHPYRHGKAAGRRTGPSCCKGVPGPMRAIAKPIYNAIGNPFSFPANAIFSLRYGGSLKRWDRAVGDYVWVPPMDAYNDGTYKRHRSKWNLAGASDTHLSGGFGPPQRRGRRAYRWTTSTKASALVAIILPEAHRITWPLAPNAQDAAHPLEVVVRWNGHEYVRRMLLPGWTDVTFDVPASNVNVGMNVIEIEAALAPPYKYSKTPPPPKDASKVGVAIGPLTIGFPYDPRARSHQSSRARRGTR